MLTKHYKRRLILRRKLLSLLTREQLEKVSGLSLVETMARGFLEAYAAEHWKHEMMKDYMQMLFEEAK